MTPKEYRESLKATLAKYGFTYCPLTNDMICILQYDGINLDTAYGIACDMNAGSQDSTITYKAILDRAKQDAVERIGQDCPFPKPNTVEAWESFIAELEDLDTFDIAHECSDWDWVIYHGRALELCQAVPSSVLHEAESQLEDMGGQQEPGLYELASTLAAIIVTDAIAEAVEEAREELLELANNQLDNMEA